MPTLAFIARAALRQAMFQCPYSSWHAVVVQCGDYPGAFVERLQKGGCPADAEARTLTLSLSLEALHHLEDVDVVALVRAAIPFEDRWMVLIGEAYTPVRADSEDRLAVARGLAAWLQTAQIPQVDTFRESSTALAPRRDDFAERRDPQHGVWS